MDEPPVRPWINHLFHDLTRQFGSFEGQENGGDLPCDLAGCLLDTFVAAERGPSCRARLLDGHRPTRARVSGLTNGR
jgi:hypothetical protein